jgi:hypothetical protein
MPRKRYLSPQKFQFTHKSRFIATEIGWQHPVEKGATLHEFCRGIRLLLDYLR